MKLDLFRPREMTTPDRWAEEHVTIDRVGKFSFDSRPFMREPTRAMGDLAGTCRVVLECSAQLSKSTALLNMLGWIYTYHPSNTLFIMDSMSSCQKIVRNRMRPFLRDQVGVASLQRGVAIKDKSSSSVNISFGTGANLMIGSARSPSDLCSFPAQFVLADETSRFPEDLGDEGDPITLLQVRMLTYPNSMFIMASTPTSEQCSIHQNYLVGTQERWCVKCPCGCYMRVAYEDIDFTVPDAPTYACEQCGTVYTESEVHDLPHLFAPPANAEPFRDKYGRVCRSFHIGATCTPEVYSWQSLKALEIEARSKGVGTYKSFVNVNLGDVYTPGRDEALDVDRMMRIGLFIDRNSLPSWIRCITVGIDTQDNRFEYVVLGHSRRGNHSIFIERGAIVGDLKKPQVWQDLKKWLSSLAYPTAAGAILYPAIVCQDSGGHFTQDVYAMSLWNKRIKPVKGHATANAKQENSIIRHETTVKVKSLGNGVAQTALTIVNTVYAKDFIRANMLELQQGKKDARFVINRDPAAGFDADFFAQINSEVREVNKGGVARWVCRQGVRNEMLDCTVYALAAYELYRLATCDVADCGADTQEPPTKDDTIAELAAALDAAVKTDAEMAKPIDGTPDALNVGHIKRLL